ncbi:MAG: hypothetical protein L0Z54_01985 [Thermoplasmata archaeon]|nr:hypothetical protein [Thermoplasmata archaeon]
MVDLRVYECEGCGRRATVPRGDPAPGCCGKRMRLLPLEPCRVAPAAEHSRPMASEDACDDSRAG